MFQFGAFPVLNGLTQKCGDVPLGYLRIKDSLRLPGAYRSLARPSSALEPSHPLTGLFSSAPSNPCNVLGANLYTASSGQYDLQPFPGDSHLQVHQTRKGSPFTAVDSMGFEPMASALQTPRSSG